MTFYSEERWIFMKAIIYSDFGHPEEVLKLMEVEKPIPQNNQVLIKVKASSLSLIDYQRFIEPIEGKEIPEATRYADTQFTPCLGKSIGIEIAGIIEEVGKDITHLKKGDEVFAVASGLFGGWAEYALANDGEVCLKPSNLTLEEAAAVPSTALTALGALRSANLQKGQHVLIIGATGGVGQFAVQIAKEFELTVTGVCSTRNLDMVRRLGADYVIDYTKENIAKCGNKYDCIMAVSGHQTLEEYKELLNPNGIYIPLSVPLLGEAQAQGENVFNDSRKVMPFYYPMVADKEMPYLKELIETGKVSPIIDKTYSVRDIANAIVEAVKDHPQGKVIIKMDF